MGAIPFFSSEFEAKEWAKQNRPFTNALLPRFWFDYARRYGRDITQAAIACREAALCGDMRRLHLGTIKLSVLMRERERAQEAGRK